MTWELNARFEQAKAEGSRLETILNGMSEAVFAMDSSLKLHLVNPKARELFNLGDNDIKAMSLLEATRSTELVETAKKALSGGAPIDTELTFHTGAEQCFQVYASPLFAVNGGSSGVVLVLQEITRLVKLERIRKDFVANVSHELRTPIQLIKGFSETLLETVEEGNKKQIVHFIEIIRKNAGIMENLTNDLLILADLENNTVNARDMEELSLAPLIDEAVSSVEPQSKRKQIEIIKECPGSLSANLYGSFIIQALINLIDNGIKYSPPKSKLWVNAYQENEELLLEVRDKGIGIPAEHLERIFERFYRVDRARSREAGGTGLGLSIVRHIAMLHKGKAEAESHAGEGSIFRIRIPLIR
jgi:two-component system phosphate regulon sensor histidine kinase PhoR